jgi:hypothetical protein
LNDWNNKLSDDYFVKHILAFLLLRMGLKRMAENFVNEYNAEAKFLWLSNHDGKHS